ncbi:hypothetical protein OX283_000215 [Flavobacterium sp. SUN052]|uniref:hypothetical protein n=1 Tax=Flavobacterium sp. SUN052 TaxID=3002441 RepID=UPI00237E055D|nr:hypothetical protein [Flavobacterium sp. SUN052]MEC4003067.1 hypothetical protein [Flavobacterium sp. SUN052]
MIFLSSNNWAQKNTSLVNKEISKTTSESIYMHLNATSFVTGETLLYKLYCLNPNGYTSSQLSKVAYVELIDSNKKIVFNHKLFLENGVGQGDYFIPASVQSGTYKLVGFTKWMLNKANYKYFEADVTVINPFQNDSENKINSENRVLEINKTNESSISTDKSSYAIREKVTLSVSDLSKGNYSISVRKIQDLPAVKKLNAVEFSKKESNQEIDFSNSSELILPELRGEIITGKITAKDNSSPINNISIALSIPGKSFEFKLVKTDKNGRFIINLDKAYYESDFVIQVYNDFKEYYSIVLDQPKSLDVTNLVINNETKLNSNLKASIEEHSVASQIENTYFEKKADSLSKIIRFPLFYEPKAKEYILDNYTRFATIKETITEVVKEMHYYKNNNIYTFYISDYDPNIELVEPPLVLIDGLLVQDLNEILEYRASNIYKICIIQSGYYYGDKLFNGLISFVTKKFDFSTNLSGDYLVKTSISPPLAKKNYYKPNYSDNLNNPRIPDYRYQLLWLPEFNYNLENQISFFTSDKTGTFEIEIEGFTDDGNPISRKHYFEVE